MSAGFLVGFFFSKPSDDQDIQASPQLCPKDTGLQKSDLFSQMPGRELADRFAHTRQCLGVFLPFLLPFSALPTPFFSSFPYLPLIEASPCICPNTIR